MFLYDIQQPGGVIVQNVLPPPDYLAVSIVSAFCCFCIGVFAILKSLKVSFILIWVTFILYLLVLFCYI